ncbi:unnamed protein product [Sphagnum troendelagicum]|uniref:Uncharacterized protein n=1 Tax=Sphagnum troendelagicum TaxID=128251 RepID=A0ABP0TMK1_9BRYO
MEAGYATSYYCRVILLRELPKVSEITSCAVVLVQGLVPREGPEDEGDRMLCEFKKRLLLQDITKTQLNSRTLTRVIAKSRRMRVKIV